MDCFQTDVLNLTFIHNDMLISTIWRWAFFLEVLPSRTQHSHSLIPGLGAEPGASLRLKFRFITPMVKVLSQTNSGKQGERDPLKIMLYPYAGAFC